MVVDVRKFIRQVERDPKLSHNLSVLLESASKRTSKAQISYQEFLEWADEDTLAEWIDGELK